MRKEMYGITIETDRDNLVSEFGNELLRQYYLRDDETSSQEAYARAATAYCAGDFALAQRIYDYVSKGWFMFSTPILSNAIRPGEKWKGLPISCFAAFTDDSLEGLIEHTSEIRWLSVKGGGTGGHWSTVRSVSDKAPGPIPFLKTMDADMLAYSQGKTRRGSYAAYLDISHPDIVEFLNLRTPTGGDPGRKCFNIHHAVCVPDKFMEALAADADWDLVDPADHTVRDTVSARKLWQQVLELRAKTGEPYIFFSDVANRALPEALKRLGLRIWGSNLCTEIMLPTSAERTFVCCLLSVICDTFDQWRHTTMVQDLIRFLDNVLQVFIDHAPSTLSKAVYSATRERALGLGSMGFHSYLQSKMIPFESAAAKALNIQIFSHMKREAMASSRLLAWERGEYPDGIGTGLRNSHLLAIAPNANSSIIGNTSPSNEVQSSNGYTHKTRAGAHLVKNKHLDRIIRARVDAPEYESTWSSIITNKGSVQAVTFLDDYEKSVFKTAYEVDQRWVIDHAGDRQPFICQGQSVNLFFAANADRAYVNEVHLRAWKRNLKSLYYYRSSSDYTVKSVSDKQDRKPLADFVVNQDECIACQA